MTPQEKLDASYTEELIYLDNIIKLFTTQITVNRNLDIGIINALSAAYSRREHVLKSQIPIIDERPVLGPNQSSNSECYERYN